MPEWSLGLISALVGAFLGYGFGRARDTAKIVQERKADLCVRLVRHGFEGQGILHDEPGDVSQLAKHRADFMVLAEELKVYVSPRAAKLIDEATGKYFVAAQVRRDEVALDFFHPETRRLVFEFLPAMQTLHAALRHEMGVASFGERGSLLLRRFLSPAQRAVSRIRGRFRRADPTSPRLTGDEDL